METLKILTTTTFYPPYHVGGDAIHVYYLANELIKLGHEIHVIYNIESYRLKKKDILKNENEFQNDENIYMYPIKSPIGRITPIISYILGTLYPVQNKIANLINKIKPDVIHHHNIAGFGPFILKMDAPKVLYTAHDYWLVCPMNSMLLPNGRECNKDANCFLCSLLHKRPIQLWRYWTNLERTLERINTIIAPSKFMKNKLSKFGIKRPISVIYNFVPEINNENLGDPIVKEPYFLFVGVLERHKGILELIETFSEIKDNIDAKLVIVGSGSLEEKIKKIIEAKNIKHSIIITGRINKKKVLSNLYRNALATIIPSICPENNPLVALESISMGTPVITSNKGGLPEITSNIDKQLIFKTYDELPEILLGFNRDKYPTEDIKKIYMKCYSPKAYIQNYTEIIRGDKV